METAASFEGELYTLLPSAGLLGLNRDKGFAIVMSENQPQDQPPPKEPNQEPQRPPLVDRFPERAIEVNPDKFMRCWTPFHKSDD